MKKIIGTLSVALVVSAFVALYVMWGQKVHVKWRHFMEAHPVSLRLTTKSAPDVVLHEETMPAKQGFDARVSRFLDAKDLAVFVKTVGGWEEARIVDEVVFKRGLELKVNAGITHVFVDNLEGPAFELRCGDLRHPVRANAKTSVAFATPLKSKVPIYMGDKSVGEILPYDDSKPGDAYILDPTAKQSYKVSRIAYGMGSGGGNSYSRPPAFLHHVGSNIDHFLENAPKTLEVKGIGSAFAGQSRVEVLRDETAGAGNK